MDIRLVAAAFEAGILPAERVAGMAAALLAEGWDSPALRVAAGADHDEPDVQRGAFRRALEELGQLPLTPEEVATRLTSFWAERILRGEVSPLEGAQALWQLDRRFGVPYDDESFGAYGALDPDEYAAPGVRDAYERDIRERAARWLATH